MRILVGRDYYDNALATGRDEAVVFLREKDRRWTDAEAKAAGFEPPSFHLSFTSSGRARGGFRDLCGPHDCGFSCNGRSHTIRPVAAWVAGKAFRGAAVHSTDAYTSFGPRGNPDFHRVHWDAAGFVAWAHAAGAAAGWRSNRWLSGAEPGGIDTWFTAGDEAPRTLVEALVAAKISVLTWVPRPEFNRERRDWRVNGDDLKDLELFRVLAPYQAFQELGMWVGGVLAGHGRPMVEIKDDRVRAAKHGFDSWSFRRPPAAARRG